MIEKGKAYACTCEREAMKKKRFAGEECEHRNRSVQENAGMFEGMLNGKYAEGEAVLRYRGDMKALNTVLRDPVLMRISKAPHYRMGTKYRVWPTYDFNTPIVDSLQGVTDVIRSKEYELHDELALQLLRILGLRAPRFHLEARLNIKGNITQKREIRALVEQGKLQGWDDPRLMTIMALRRRGITPEGIRNFIMRLGMTKTDSTVPFDMLLAENRKVIDPMAKHLFFVPNPIRLKVGNIIERHVQLALHPQAKGKAAAKGAKAKKAERDYKIGDTFLISGEDARTLTAGEVLRLKDLMDIKTIYVQDDEVAAVREEKEGIRDKTIQWVPESSHIGATVLVPEDLTDEKGELAEDSLDTVHGEAEGYAKKLKNGDIVQFERFGYCILDDREKMRFIFISK
jgi:glutamyl-tRNA synthetase